MRISLALFLVPLAGLTIAACGSNDNANGAGPSSSSKTLGSAGSSYAQPASGSSGSSSSSSGGLVEMDDNYFKPKVVNGKPGETVTIKLKNEGKVAHNFKIDGQKAADADVPPGNTASVKVKIPMSGSVQFYCEYHKKFGMVGTVKAS